MIKKTCLSFTAPLGMMDRVMTVSLTLWLGLATTIVDDNSVFVFVGDANTHQYEWLESVSPSAPHERDGFEFWILKSCEQ